MEEEASNEIRDNGENLDLLVNRLIQFPEAGFESLANLVRRTRASNMTQNQMAINADSGCGNGGGGGDDDGDDDDDDGESDDPDAKKKKEDRKVLERKLKDAEKELEDRKQKESDASQDLIDAMSIENSFKTEKDDLDKRIVINKKNLKLANDKVCKSSQKHALCVHDKKATENKIKELKEELDKL